MSTKCFILSWSTVVDRTYVTTMVTFDQQLKLHYLWQWTHALIWPMLGISHILWISKQMLHTTQHTEFDFAPCRHTPSNNPLPLGRHGNSHIIKSTRPQIHFIENAVQRHNHNRTLKEANALGAWTYCSCVWFAKEQTPTFFVLLYFYKTETQTAVFCYSKFGNHITRYLANNPAPWLRL